MSLTLIETTMCTDVPAKRKLELCKGFTQEGFCRYGQACFFAHGIDQLIRHQPTLKKKMCRNFHTHKFCKFGSRCNFLHEVKEFEQIGKKKPFKKMMDEYPEFITQIRFRKNLLQFL